MAKHRGKREGRKVIQLKDHLPKNTPDQEPQASIEYEGDPSSSEKKREDRKAPKAFYRAAVVLLVLVLGLALWVNRDNLTPQSVWNWIQVQVTGSGSGDGYPVGITGSNVTASNFMAAEGGVAVLSDTSLTILGSSGQEIFSQRHSFNQPILREASGNYLLYNQNSTGYMVVSGTEVKIDSSTQKDILAGAISADGRYALATRGEDGASDVTVYLATGEVQYTYNFSSDYVTALALNSDGTKAMVCTVRSQGGQLVSKVTVLDLNSTTPAGEYETADNLLFSAYWGENGLLYAVGDSVLLRARSSDFAFSEYSYQGKTPTAQMFSNGNLYLSVSSYEHAGACTVLVFRNMEEPVEIQTEERVTCLSVSGGSVGTLMGQELVLYDASTGQELAREDVGSDAKSIALSSESLAYVLGVSEIRRVQMG